MIEPDEDNSTEYLAFKQRYAPLPSSLPLTLPSTLLPSLLSSCYLHFIHSSTLYLSLSIPDPSAHLFSPLFIPPPCCHHLSIDESIPSIIMSICHQPIHFASMMLSSILHFLLFTTTEDLFVTLYRTLPLSFPFSPTLLPALLTNHWSGKERSS